MRNLLEYDLDFIREFVVFSLIIGDSKSEIRSMILSISPSSSFDKSKEESKKESKEEKEKIKLLESFGIYL